MNDFNVSTAYNRKKYGFEEEYVRDLQHMTTVQHFSSKVNKETIIAFCENNLYAKVFKIAMPILNEIGYSKATERSKSPHYKPPTKNDYVETL